MSSPSINSSLPPQPNSKFILELSQQAKVITSASELLQSSALRIARLEEELQSSSSLISQLHREIAILKAGNTKEQDLMDFDDDDGDYEDNKENIEPEEQLVDFADGSEVEEGEIKFSDDDEGVPPVPSIQTNGNGVINYEKPNGTSNGVSYRDFKPELYSPKPSTRYHVIATNEAGTKRSLSPDTNISNTSKRSNVDDFFFRYLCGSFPFDPEKDTDIVVAFHNLCRHYNLHRGTTEERKAFAAFHVAIVEDLADVVDKNKSEGEEGIDTVFRMLRMEKGNRTHGLGNFINIYDLLEALRSPYRYTPKLFNDLEGLMSYCRESNRFFPINFIPKGSCLNSFLNPVSGTKSAFATAIGVHHHGRDGGAGSSGRKRVYGASGGGRGLNGGGGGQGGWRRI